MLRLLRFPRSPREASATSPEAIDPLGALAHAAAQGDRRAQRTLLVSVGPALLRVVRGVLGVNHPDVQDVLQESMAALHGALPTFRGECKVLHFSCRVAVQTALSARRRAGYRERYTPLVAPDELFELATAEGSASDTLAARERRETLRTLLDELPEAQAEALVLHLVLGYSVDETASAQRVPVNTARSRLRAGLASLRASATADPNISAKLRLDP